MSGHRELLEKLAKIEALIAGTDSASERAAAREAHERLKQRLEMPRSVAEMVEFKIMSPDTWHAELLKAVCRKHGLSPYRKNRQKHTTVMVQAESYFFENTVWPEYERYARHFEDLVEEITGQLIGKIYASSGFDR